MNMGVKSTFGENLKHYRKEKRLSQERLSEILDISIKHLSAIERGLNFVSADLLENLSRSLEIPVYQFFIKETEIMLNESSFEKIERIIEKNLIKAIENIKMEIRQSSR